MQTIRVESAVDDLRLLQLGVKTWPVWQKEVSEFPWQYNATEVAYVLEGKVTVVPDQGEAVSFAAGDLVTFPAGLQCVWQIHSPLRKHYSFDFPDGI